MLRAAELNVLRIGVTDRILGDNIGGTREILGDLAARLGRIDYIVHSPRRHGHEVTVLGERFAVHPTRSRSRLHFFRDAGRLARELLHQRRYHLVESLDPMGSGLVGWRLARRGGLPWLAICHSDYWSSPAWRRTSARYALVDRWLGTFLLRRADHVRAASRRVRDDGVALGVRAERVTVLNLPIRTQLFAPGAESLERYSRRRALFVGRLDAQKDVATLLRAWRLLLDRGAPARLTLVGSGPEQRRLEALAHELGLGDAAEFAGFRRQEELPGLYRASSLFVLPSIHEALGQVIVEAGLCGLATVGTNVGGIPESVVDGETGLLVPPGDPPALAAALARLLDDPAAARRMGQEAQRRLGERWDYERGLAAYVELLIAVAAAGQRRR